MFQLRSNSPSAPPLFQLWLLQGKTGCSKKREEKEKEESLGGIFN